MEPTQTTLSRTKRWYVIDYAKAIAIILVVIGHFHPDGEPHWWACVRQVIYSFHMPLFMFASGFLYMASSKKYTYGAFLRNKFKRLMIPYFATSIIVITIKLLTQGNAFVEHPVTVYNYVSMLYSPSAGYFLWFIWALWWMFVIVPLFKGKRARLILFTSSIVLSYLPWRATHLFCLYEAQNMFVFFMLGAIVYDQKEKLALFKNLTPWAYAIAFIGGEVVYLALPASLVYGKIILPYLGIAASLSLCRQLSHSGNVGLKTRLLGIAGYSYGIYLFHTTFEGFAKAFALKLPLAVDPDGASFAMLAMFVSVCGVIFPVLLYRIVLSKSRITRIIFGLPTKA